MSRKRVVVGLTILFGLAVVGFVFGLWLTAPTHRINKQTFDALAVGMTEGQVVRALGIPAGDYATPGMRPDFNCGTLGASLAGCLPPGGPADGWCWWLSDAGCIYVQFDDQR